MIKMSGDEEHCKEIRNMACSPPVHGEEHVRLAVLPHALLDGQEVLPRLQHHLQVEVVCRVLV